MNAPIMTPFDLAGQGITVSEIHRNLSPSKLYEHAIRYEKDASIAENGALVAYSGLKTGRSPKDNRVVKNAASENDIWWGAVNIPLDPRTFDINRQRAQDYLNTRERLYCFDGFAGWDAKYRLKVRVICSRPYTRCLCTPCSFGRRTQSLTPLAPRISLFTTREPSRRTG
jgi:phosphoenolpyruvate carboxykinase (ATP)